MNKFLKDLLSVSLSKAGIIIFGLGRVIITARWLGPEANGLIAALSVYPVLFMSIGSLGIRQATTYFVGKETFPLESIKRGVIQVWVFSTIVSLIICYLLIRKFSNSGNNLIMVLLAIAPIPFNLFNTYSSGIFLGKNNFSHFNKIEWLPSMIICVFTILLVVIIEMNTYGAMIAAITGPLLMTIILLFKSHFIRSFSFKFEKKIIKSLISLGLVYAISLLVINLNYKVSIIIMDQRSTDYQLGIYAKGASLIEYLWQIPMLFSTLIFARSANAKDDKIFSQKVTHLLRLSSIVITAISLLLMLTSKWIILLLFGESFLPSAEALVIMLPGVLLLTIFKVLNMDLAGKGKPWVSMKAMVPAVILNIAMNWYLVPEYGANGAAFAATISYSVSAMLFLHFYSKEVSISIREILRFKLSDFDIIKQIIISGKKKLISA